MTDFTREHRRRTRSPVVKVEPLPPGRYRFELVVTDTAGNDSAPAQVEVIVEPAQMPRGPTRGIVSRPDGNGT